MTTHERFILVMADLMRKDIPNTDPMRFSKRSAIQLARAALENGVSQAEQWLHMLDAIESDAKDCIKGEA